MSKIVTITFSPCIDKSTTIPVLIHEKKLQCSSPILEPGGGGINVARAISHLGGQAIAVFPSGGYTGKYFNHLLEIEKIQTVVIGSANETRENFIVLDESANRQYRFGMPGTPLSESEWRLVLTAVEQMNDVAYIVASGSLPPGVPLNIYAQLAKIAVTKNAKLCVDTSGEPLRKALEAGVFLLKPNLGELKFLAGREKIDPVEIEMITRELIVKNNCHIMVISLGKEGAMLVTPDAVYKAQAPEVKIKSTVGAGDSMLAGIVYFISEGRHLLDALQYGVACGTAATLNTGTRLCDKHDVDNLYVLIKR